MLSQAKRRSFGFSVMHPIFIGVRDYEHIHLSVIIEN